MQRQQQQQRINDPVLLNRVASELESIRDMDLQRNNNSCCSSSTSSCSSSISSNSSSNFTSTKSYNDIGVKFPDACLQLLQSLPGNQQCVDCGKRNPDWASITYGVLMCLQCSGIHRSYGVQVSYIRSIQYDTWNHQQIVSLLEGGNAQLRTFFHRHQLLDDSGINNNTQAATCNKKLLEQQHLFKQRYHTKAALFYNVHLKQHVAHVIQNGVYRGREYNRQQKGSSNHNHKIVEHNRAKSPTTVVVARCHREENK